MTEKIYKSKLNYSLPAKEILFFTSLTNIFGCAIILSQSSTLKTSKTVSTTLPTILLIFSLISCILEFSRDKKITRSFFGILTLMDRVVKNHHQEILKSVNQTLTFDNKKIKIFDFWTGNPILRAVFYIILAILSFFNVATHVSFYTYLIGAFLILVNDLQHEDGKIRQSIARRMTVKNINFANNLKNEHRNRKKSQGHKLENGNRIFFEYGTVAKSKKSRTKSQRCRESSHSVVTTNFFDSDFDENRNRMELRDERKTQTKLYGRMDSALKEEDENEKISPNRLKTLPTGRGRPPGSKNSNSLFSNKTARILR